MAKSSGMRDAPSITGNKSGSGRSNNPPSKPSGNSSSSKGSLKGNSKK